jgi:response regulator RpfG family c-di-GMP phosphodiesterase
MESPRILIVDDSSFVRNHLEKELQIFNAIVTQAEDGRHGLDLALLESFDLIISDVDMPYMDGFTLCQKLKQNPNTKGIPVILLSSIDTDQYIDKGFHVGADSYVSKSEAKPIIQETIQRVLKKSKFLRGHLILVVDDSNTIRSIVKDAFEKAGFNVITADNGKTALDIVKSHTPDLIISDIDMPEMDGLTLCKKVHSDPDLSTIPFVIMSSNNDRSIMRRMLNLGASAYLVKPFNPEQVVITVEKLLSDHYLLLLKEKERLGVEREMMLASITSLITALEARDHYTSGHSEAVSMLVTEMAVKMNLPFDDIETLGIAGKLHDLGKIGVPDSILLKPGKLSEKEFEMIKQHPVVGVNILGAIPSLKHALPAIRHHHERFDGKGYPDGIKGKKIPIWARMMAVADTYHALTSDRPYRDGVDQDKALGIIQEVRETQLCPECIDIFIDMIYEIQEEKLERVRMNLVA